MEFRLLGEVELWAGGRRHPMGTRLQQTVFAVLLADAGRRVPVETLIDRVWGDLPPRKAPRDLLYSYVSRIRRTLKQAAETGAEEPTRIESGPAGYLLRVEPTAVDLHLFRRIVADAEDLPPVERAARLSEALALWHGPALAGIQGGWADLSRSAWRQEWLDSTISWATAQAAAGRPDVVTRTLPEVAAEFPLAEPVEALLIGALHMTGRAAEALDRYAVVQRRLADELGSDPGRDLRVVHEALLHAEVPSHLGAMAAARTPEGFGPPAGQPTNRSDRDGAERRKSTAGGARPVPVPADADGRSILASRRGRADERRPLAAAARALAWDIAEQEAAVLQRLLADTGDARPADVGFAQPTGAELRWRTDGGDRDGALSTIADFYRGLDRGRLVVLGEPGAGKTVAAIQLLLDLVQAQASAQESDADLRVLVRLSLSAFPAGTERGPTADVVRRRLDDWITDQLAAGYGQNTATAKALMAQGWILPILDGLDEMDPGDGDPVRARAVVAALNHPTGPTLRPIVVTCRTELYGRLAIHPAAAGTPPVVQDATVVIMQPMPADHVTRWLAHRFPDPTSPTGSTQRWQPVVRELIDRPNDALARSLASPLRLYLAVTAYRDPASTPGELCTITPGDMDSHLFSRLIPAVTARHPRPGGADYRAEDVTRWMATLARHLDLMRGAGRSGTDLHLQDLWRSTGSPRHPGRTVRYLCAALYVLIPAPLLPIAGWRVSTHAHAAPSSWFTWIGLFCGAAFTVGTARSALRRNGDLRRADLGHLRTPAGRARLTGWLAAGFLGGAVTGVAINLAVPLSADPALVLAVACGCGVTAGLAAGLMSGLGSHPVAIDRPSKLTTQGIAYDVITILVVGSAFGLTVGPWFGLEFGVAFGLTCGLLRRAASPWPRYSVAVWALRRSGELPRRPAVFLDWGFQAGLLRLSGVAVQFRHRELQSWLSQRAPMTSTVDLSRAVGSGGMTRPDAPSQS